MALTNDHRKFQGGESELHIMFGHTSIDDRANMAVRNDIPNPHLRKDLTERPDSGEASLFQQDEGLGQLYHFMQGMAHIDNGNQEFPLAAVG